MSPWSLFMPLLAVVLFVLPVKLPPKQLLKLAFSIWMVGGKVLTLTGTQSLMNHPITSFDPGFLPIAAAIALAIGYGKGKFVLAKTSQRNIQRISEMSEPQRLINVYSVRSWVMITLMICISLSLTWFGAPWDWRGLVRLAVGFALIMSSLNYLRAASPETNAIAAE